MVYYRKIIKTTTYAGRNFFVYIIEENEDDKTGKKRYEFEWSGYGHHISRC